MQQIEQWIGKHPIVFVSLLGFFIFLLGLLFWIGEDYRHWQMLIKEEVLLRKEIDTKQQQFVDLKKAKNQVKVLENRLINEEKRFSLQNESSTLLEEMTALGLQMGLKFKTFFPDAEEQRFDYRIMPIQMDLSGTFYQLYDFLEKIAQLNYFVLVDEMQLKSNSQSLQAHLLIKIYWVANEAH